MGYLRLGHDPLFLDQEGEEFLELVELGGISGTLGQSLVERQE